MAHFYYTYPIPTLPAYLFDADLTAAIVPPQNLVVVPGVDQQIHLYWSKHINTSDAATDLYAEIYRSRDLENWDLIAVRQWLNYDYYSDDDVLNGYIYYYKIRFVRKDGDGVITNTSDYTLTLSARAVNALGFEPQDDWANKFLNYMLNVLPGTRIYDRTSAATFSANEQLWQTTCRITDSFKVMMDGSTVHEAAADASALYAKRPISFVMTSKHVKLKGQDTMTGAYGEETLVSAYLIHTFLMAYAQQFMTLYEKYLQIVADKYIDYSQVYTKGFKPSITTRSDIPIAELYASFGKLLRIKPLKAQTTEQGLNKYRSVLKNSFTNVINVGKVKAIGQACRDIFGMTTQTLLEYYKQHWFKSDREMKIYKAPSITDPMRFATGLQWTSGGGNNLIFNLADDRFTAFIEYVVDPSGIGLTGAGEGWLEVAGSGADSPYTYLFRVHLSGDPQVAANCTTAAEVHALFTADPIANSILTVAASGGVETGVIFSGFDAQLVRSHSLWAGWEDSLLNMYGRKFNIQDTVSPLTLGTDYAVMSLTISEQSPNNTISAIYNTAGPEPSWMASTDVYLWKLLAQVTETAMIVARDDNGEGVGFGGYITTPGDGDPLVYGSKRALIKVGLTQTKMQWLTKATLKIFVRLSTSSGYLRLYRIRKRYDNSVVCWNYRDKELVPDTGLIPSWTWGGSSYTSLYTGTGGESWVTEDWQTDGAKGSEDSVFLKEFYIPKVENPAWVSLDITDVLQNIYKYETSRLDMGEDPENILYTGFMLTADGYENRSMIVIESHENSTFKPRVSWQKLPHGPYACTPDATTYFYVDGTTRYGRLLVKQSDTEPSSYIRTVNERIRQQDILYTNDMTVVLATPPPVDMTAGVIVYGETSTAVGTISSVSGSTLYVKMALRAFQAGENIRVLDPVGTTVVVSTVSYTGNMYVRLSRMPTSDSILRVYHEATATVPATPPSDYPAYTTWTEAGPGILPVFLNAASGTVNEFATFDTNEHDVINLNVTDPASVPGDVIVTYQYMYDYVLLGQTVADSDSILKIGGSNRVGEGLFIQRENDYLYKSELMLPKPVNGSVPDISGNPTGDDYSDFNIGVLCDAISNIRRLDGQVDVFKYDIEGKPYYRFGQLYHTFFKRT